MYSSPINKIDVIMASVKKKKQKKNEQIDCNTVTNVDKSPIDSINQIDVTPVICKQRKKINSAH